MRPGGLAVVNTATVWGNRYMRVGACSLSHMDNHMDNNMDTVCVGAETRRSRGLRIHAYVCTLRT